MYEVVATLFCVARNPIYLILRVTGDTIRMKVKSTKPTHDVLIPMIDQDPNDPTTRIRIGQAWTLEDGEARQSGLYGDPHPGS